MILQKIKKSIFLLITGSLLVSFTGVNALALAPKSSTSTDAVSSATTKSEAPKLDTKAIKTKLDALVKSKTITSAQATKVLAVYTKMATNRPARPEGNDNKENTNPPKDGTNPPGEQKDGPKMDGGKKPSEPLSELVKAKTITQKQSEAITKAISTIKATTSTTKK